MTASIALPRYIGTRLPSLFIPSLTTIAHSLFFHIDNTRKSMTRRVLAKLCTEIVCVDFVAPIYGHLGVSERCVVCELCASAKGPCSGQGSCESEVLGRTNLQAKPFVSTCRERGEGICKKVSKKHPKK